MNNNKKYFLIVGVILLVIITLIWLGNNAQESVMPSVDVEPELLPGIQTGDAPWSVESDRLRERLSVIGLPALSKEGSALHIHEHLDIVIDGKPVPVPPDIGVNEKDNFISPIHTHGADAIIHVESPTARTFTLGQFFDIWGVRFTDKCIGGYCNARDKNLKVFVNGTRFDGNPRDIKLAERQEIVVTYGVDKDMPNPIPSKFDFPAGL